MPLASREFLRKTRTLLHQEHCLSRSSKSFQAWAAKSTFLLKKLCLIHGRTFLLLVVWVQVGKTINYVELWTFLMVLLKMVQKTFFMMNWMGCKLKASIDLQNLINERIEALFNVLYSMFTNLELVKRTREYKYVSLLSLAIIFLRQQVTQDKIESLKFWKSKLKFGLQNWKR